MGRLRSSYAADPSVAALVSLPQSGSFARVALIRHDGELQLRSLTGELLASSLPNHDLNRAFVKKGRFVSYEVIDQKTNPVRVSIQHILYPKQIEGLKEAGRWPAQPLPESDDPSDVDTDDISSSDSDDGKPARVRERSQSARKKRGTDGNEMKFKPDDSSQKLIGQITDFLDRIKHQDEPKITDGAAHEPCTEVGQEELDEWGVEDKVADVEDEEEHQEEEEGDGDGDEDDEELEQEEGQDDELPDEEFLDDNEGFDVYE